MTKTVKYLAGIVAVITIFSSCIKEMGNEPLCNDQSAPAPVTNIQVENRPGNSKITYSVPADKNLLYIQAEWIPTNGEASETKASYYEDSLVVNGFADTLEHEVKLYSVSRCGAKSAPVVVKIKPLEAPIFQVFRSLQIVNAFGGFNILASNPVEGSLGIIVLTLNKFKEYEVNNNWSVYTDVKDVLAKVRGLDTITQRIGFFVQDRRGNKTDTLYQDITPIYEVELNKANFKPYKLPGDAPQVTNGARLEYAWDNRTGWPYTSFTDQTSGGPDPHLITFDLGIMAKISRIWIRPFPELNPQQFYFLTALREFEVYGSNAPSPDGALDNSWELLNEYEVIKPSGTSYGKDTDLDRQTASAGFNWEIRLSAPKVRYLRIRCKKNWAGGTAQSINELTVYGDPR